VLQFKNEEIEIDLQKRLVKKKRQFIDLTPREFDILATLMRDPNKVFTRDELIKTIIGKYGGLPRVIDSHVSNLRSKLEESSKNPVYVITVYRVGYRFGGQSDTEDKNLHPASSIQISSYKPAIEQQRDFIAEF
jgi:DNA-binding response OmpR family regulator